MRRKQKSRTAKEKSKTGVIALSGMDAITRPDSCQLCSGGRPNSDFHALDKD